LPFAVDKPGTYEVQLTFDLADMVGVVTTDYTLTLRGTVESRPVAFTVTPDWLLVR
jgi:hypothetical protein